MTFEPRQNWHRNEAGVYDREVSSFELVLPPDIAVTRQNDPQKVALFENRFYGKRGSSLFFMLDPTIHRSENIQTDYEITDRDRGPVNAALRAEVRDAERAAEAAAASMVLGLLVNPQSISISMAKNFGQAFTRAGWTIAHNYTEHPQVRLSGTTGAFYSAVTQTVDEEGNAVPTTALDVGGLSRQQREWSGAYQNLIDILAFFKQNGAVRRLADRVRIRRLMKVFLFFEGWTFVGSFQSINISETADKPFLLSYDIGFEVHEMWHATWPQSTDVVAETKKPDELRRTEMPDTIIGAQPRNRETPAAETFANAQAHLNETFQLAALNAQFPVAPPGFQIQSRPVIIPVQQRGNVPDITNTAQ